MYFTEKQLRIMKFIQQYRSERGISPTMEEIAERVGVTKITVYDHLNQLEHKGALKRERFRARSIEPLVWVGHEKGQFVLPLREDRGDGELAEGSETAGCLDLKSIFPLNPQCFALLVRGRSLAGDLFRDGDHVIIDRRVEPRSGDIVYAALPGGRRVIARYWHDRNRVRLQNSESGGKPICARIRDVEIKGVVVRLLRSFTPPERN